MFIQHWNKDSNTASLMTLNKLMEQEAERQGLKNTQRTLEKALTGVQKGELALALDTDFNLHLWKL